MTRCSRKIRALAAGRAVAGNLCLSRQDNRERRPQRSGAAWAALLCGVRGDGHEKRDEEKEPIECMHAPRSAGWRRLLPPTPKVLLVNELRAASRQHCTTRSIYFDRTLLQLPGSSRRVA